MRERVGGWMGDTQPLGLLRSSAVAALGEAPGACAWEQQARDTKDVQQHAGEHGAAHSTKHAAFSGRRSTFRCSAPRGRASRPCAQRVHRSVLRASAALNSVCAPRAQRSARRGGTDAPWAAAPAAR